MICGAMRLERGGFTSRAAVVLAAALALAVTPGAARAAAPTATTGPATAIGATTATVTGTVNPGGLATTWHIEYGTSTSYGSVTPSVSAGSGTSATNVTANLTGLKPGTTYHYRLVATNTSGTSHGSDALFTTLVPPDVVTGAATSVGATSATLNGTVDPNGRETTYWFEYGTSTAYGSKTAVASAGSGTTPTARSATVSGLQAGRTYHFRIVAMSDAGTATGNDATFTTGGVPTAVTGTADSIGKTSATIHGTVTPNGLTTTWWFEYGTTTSYGSKTSSQSAGSGTGSVAVAKSISGLRTATTYHFRVVAENSSGRTNGADQTFSTARPPSVQTATAQAVAADSAQLTGTLDTLGRTTTWWFQYGTSTKYGLSTPAQNGGSKAGVQSVATTVTGLSPTTTYHFRLVAKNDIGTTYGRDATFTTTGVTLAAGARQLVYGGRVRLSGIVPTRRAGEQVLIFSEPFGSGSFRAVATVLSDATGAWTYLARPGIATSYAASWHGGLSASVSIAVHPRVTLVRLRSGRFVVRVAGGRSFAHRVVQLQRRIGVRWVTVRRVRLGLRSRVEFRATLPTGRSVVRAAFSINQAGPGFLGGMSRALSVRR
jgi:hypothetical protein